jgi:aminocarboxymuconate-semialdehyde decarboxylase
MAGALKCIDCQSHIFSPAIIRHMRERKEPPFIYDKEGASFLAVGKWHRPMVKKAMDLEAKLADMDRLGIDMAALSTNDPGPEHFGIDGPAVARMVHDFLAETQHRYPGRFFLLATLPLTDMDASLVELDRCVNDLGMKGILLYSNIVGRFPDEPEFAPLFQRAEELDLPVLLHPPYPVMFEATLGYNLTGGLGLMFDTTIALCRLILSGIFDKYPQLKLVCPHVGGTLPYLIGRIDHQVCVLKRTNIELKKRPSEYLKQNVYLDTVNVLPSVIRFGYDFVGPDRLLFATDHPWVEADITIENLRSLRLPPEHEAKILSENARKLFKL